MAVLPVIAGDQPIGVLALNFEEAPCLRRRRARSARRAREAVRTVPRAREAVRGRTPARVGRLARRPPQRVARARDQRPRALPPSRVAARGRARRLCGRRPPRRGRRAPAGRLEPPRQMAGSRPRRRRGAGGPRARERPGRDDRPPAGGRPSTRPAARASAPGPPPYDRACSSSRRSPGAREGALGSEWLRELADHVALAVDNARLYEREQNASRTLQLGLLGGELPQPPGTSLVAAYRPGTVTNEVGGDWYDAFTLDNGKLAILVGDVVGHDLEAAVAMGQLRGAVRALASLGSPGALLERLDSFVSRLRGGAMTTMAYAELEIASGELCYACAGHPPPLAVSGAGEPRFLWGGRSGPLGIDAQSRPEERDRLARDDTLVLYTDGLIERKGREPRGRSRAAERGCEHRSGRRPPVDARPAPLVNAGRPSAGGRRLRDRRLPPRGIGRCVHMVGNRRKREFLANHVYYVRGVHMSLLQLCRHPGCTTLTIGGLCVEHEPVQEARVFPRGRPFPPLQHWSAERPVVSLPPPGVIAAGSGAAT